jgi:Kef-type K+ transport system membrane component KefB
LWLYKEYGGKAPFVPFALFMGISMSITAFPVLARIIQERGLRGTDLGNTAITCAAVDDVTAWCGLAFIVAMAKSQTLMHSALTVGLTIAFFALVLFVIRPMLQKMADRLPDVANPDKRAVVVCLGFVFFCAFSTEAIGIHALFGAFLAGVAMPKDEAFRLFLRQRLEYFSSLFLLPIFFAFTGLRTQIGLVSTPTDWAVCAALLGIAILGKFGGSMTAARLTGMSWRDSAAIGALMNTRGLVELIVLNLGLDLGILTPKVFSMLVLMALITTFATGPIIDWLGIGTRAKRTDPQMASEQALDSR